MREKKFFKKCGNAELGVLVLKMCGYGEQGGNAELGVWWRTVVYVRLCGCLVCQRAIMVPLLHGELRFPQLTMGGAMRCSKN